MYVSGTIEGGYLIVTRVHLRTPPPDAIRVIEYCPHGAKPRKPRAGDRLRYYPGPDGQKPHVYSPERAKPGANPKGKGLRLYLPVEVADALRALAASEGKTPNEVVAQLVLQTQQEPKCPPSSP
jgi:hypothetical protein